MSKLNKSVKGGKMGETSDGYHTFNELYDHRIALFIALMRSHPEISWKARKHEDGTMFDGWFIAGMHLPTGDISYHLPFKYWVDTIDILSVIPAPHWDGHTPQDVVKRLLKWTKQIDKHANPIKIGDE